MSKGPTLRRAVIEVLLIAAAFVVVNVLMALFQEPIQVHGGRGFDGVFYHRVAQQLVAGAPIEGGRGMFMYRVGTPWLASLVFPDDLILSFKVVNVVANTCTAVLLFWWLRMNVGTWWVRVLLCVLYFTHWLVLVRFTYFYPVLADPWSATLCLAGLVLLARIERRPSWWAFGMFSAVCVAGVFFRQMLILVAVTGLFVFAPVRKSGRFPLVQLNKLRPTLKMLLPLGLAVVGLALLRRFVSPGDAQKFSTIMHLAKVAHRHAMLDVLHGWLLAFGPVLFLVLFSWRRAAKHLAEHQFQLVHLAMIAVLGWVASYESERHMLNWAAPIVLVLIGKAIEENGSRLRSWPLVAFLAATQALAQRLFWLVPPHVATYKRSEPLVLLTPLGEDAAYLHLFPNYAPLATKVQGLVGYAVVGVVLLLWLSYRKTKLDDAERGTSEDAADEVSARRGGQAET